MPTLDKEEWYHFMKYTIENSTEEELELLKQDLEFFLGMTYGRKRRISK